MPLRKRRSKKLRSLLETSCRALGSESLVAAALVPARGATTLDRRGPIRVDLGLGSGRAHHRLELPAVMAGDDQPWFRTLLPPLTPSHRLRACRSRVGRIRQPPQQVVQRARRSGSVTPARLQPGVKSRRATLSASPQATGPPLVPLAEGTRGSTQRRASFLAGGPSRDSATHGLSLGEQRCEHPIIYSGKEYNDYYSIEKRAAVKLGDTLHA